MEGAFSGGGVGAGTSNLPSGGQRLRPLGVGETLDVALKLYRARATSLWQIVASVIVPLEIIVVIIDRVTLPSDVYVQNGQLYTNSLSGVNSASGTIALIVVGLLGLFGQLLSHGATFKLLLDGYLGRSTDVGQSFAFASHRLMSLLWLVILITVMVAIGFILIIPGIWLIVAFSVAVPVLMLEGLRGWAALRRSMDLVHGRWWATFGRLVAMLLMYIVALIVIGVIAGALRSGLSVTNVTLFVLIGGILQAVVVILLTPFIAATITVIYIDLRVRKEALDIELLASRFGGPGSTVPAGTPPVPPSPFGSDAGADTIVSPPSSSIPPPSFTE